jgi:hypothetical protein
MYFWQGKDASKRIWPMFLMSLGQTVEEKLVSAGYKAPEKIQVFQQKEPPSFAQLFNNTIVIHRGNRQVRCARFPLTNLP